MSRSQVVKLELKQMRPERGNTLADHLAAKGPVLLLLREAGSVVQMYQDEEVSRNIYYFGIPVLNIPKSSWASWAVLLHKPTFVKKVQPRPPSTNRGSLKLYFHRDISTFQDSMEYSYGDAESE